jgi:hypothetical protein
MNAWDQQEGETPKAYAAFCAYRDITESRSLRKAAQNLNKTLTHIAEWSEHWDWVGRCRAYDAYLELKNRKTREAEHAAELAAYRERMRKSATDTAAIAQAILLKTGRRLQSLDPETIEPAMLSGLIRAAAAVMESSRNMEAEAIGVRRLESLLDDLDDSDETD